MIGTEVAAIITSADPVYSFFRSKGTYSTDADPHSFVYNFFIQAIDYNFQYRSNFTTKLGINQALQGGTIYFIG